MGKTKPPRYRTRKNAVRSTPDSPSTGSAKRTWAAALILAAVTFAVYSPVLRFPFVNYDDVDYVTENSHVQQGLTLDTLSWALTSTAQANWHPLTWVSHALDCQLFGLDPEGHHFTSLLLHAANAVLLFLLLRRATGKPRRSLVVAALFALHPINVESVAWVAERKTVLSMFFILLTLAAYGWYARRPRIAVYLFSSVMFVLALAAKPMAVTLPFVLLLLDFWPLQRVEHGLPPSLVFPVPQFSVRHLMMEKLPFLALSAASSAVTLVAQHPAMKTMAAVPFGGRVANAIFSYGMYVWKAFWPARLSVFYAPQGERLHAWQIALCLVFLGTVTAFAWRARLRGYPLVGWLWFLGTLVPMLGLVQVGEQGMADRYAYLPFLGIFLVVIWASADLCADKKINVRAQRAVSGAALLVLSFLTWRQIHTWESSFALWSHSLQVTGDNYVAEDFVGTTLLEDAFKATGESCADQALVHFQNAVRINPQDALGHLNVGFCRQARGRLRDAVAEYQIALQWARNRYVKSRAYINLGGAYDELGDLQTAGDYFNQALRIFPHDADILQALAKLEVEKRIEELSRAASAHPTAPAYLQLAQLQQEVGHLPEARASYERALRLDPKMAEARSALKSLEPASP
jgi:Tfp pilus assembly protein PilF